MSITRREFVTRLGALAAVVGMSQADIGKMAEALAHGGTKWGTKKPKVIWVHGAECTGCSTSLLGLFENAAGRAIEDTSLVGYVSTLTALNLVAGTSVLDQTKPGHPFGHYTLGLYGGGVAHYDNVANGGVSVNIADVLIDFIDLQYHETVMGSGSDLAYQFLKDQIALGNDGDPYIVVVEGAIQPKNATAYWAGQNVSTTTPWCSIGVDGTPVDLIDGAIPEDYDPAELSFDDVVFGLVEHAKCAAVVAIGQCASYGGYPGAVSPVYKQKQTPAMGVSDFLGTYKLRTDLAAKVINAPGCPTNPWWFVLTVVAWLVDAVNGPFASTGAKAGPLGILDATGAVKASAVDYGGRLKAVYGLPVHGPGCPRYADYTAGVFATKPGDSGCLKLIGCKGPQTNSMCAYHGWNGRQPHNDPTWDYGVGADQGKRGGFCVTAGHPCMGCTEKGYPDAFVPFVKL